MLLRSACDVYVTVDSALGLCCACRDPSKLDDGLQQWLQACEQAFDRLLDSLLQSHTQRCELPHSVHADTVILRRCCLRKSPASNTASEARLRERRCSAAQGTSALQRQACVPIAQQLLTACSAALTLANCNLRTKPRVLRQLHLLI